MFKNIAIAVAVTGVAYVAIKKIAGNKKTASVEVKPTPVAKETVVEQAVAPAKKKLSIVRDKVTTSASGVTVVDIGACSAEEFTALLDKAARA